MTKKFQQKN